MSGLTESWHISKEIQEVHCQFEFLVRIFGFLVLKMKKVELIEMVSSFDKTAAANVTSTLKTPLFKAGLKQQYLKQ